MGDRLPLARGLPPCPSLPSSSSRDRGPADPLGHPSGFQVGKLWPASSSGPAAIRTGTRAAQRQPSLSPSPSCAHPGWSGGSQRRLSPRLSPLRLLPGSNPAQGLAQTLLLPPLTLGWVCPLGGKEGHPTLSNPGGSQPRTERDGGKAKSYESCDLMRGCVPGISNPCPMSHQFITDVTFMSPALAGEFFNASTTWEAHLTYDWMLIVTSFGELGPGLKGPEIFPGHSLGRCNQLWNPLKPVSVSTAPSLSPHSRIRSWLYY